MKIELNKYTNKMLSVTDLNKYRRKGNQISKSFISGELSFINDLSSFVTKEDLNQIVNIADYIKNNCEVFLVIGTGGSYITSKALIEALTDKNNKSYPEIIYLGYDLSSSYYKEVIEYIKNKSIIVDVISKSGDTLETNIAFDIINYVMGGKYSEEELANRIIITSNGKSGKLHNMALENNYCELVIPKEIGGRFSAATVVGLLPMAVANIDIISFLEGFVNGNNYLNEAVDYATIRESLYNKGKYVELYELYDGKLFAFGEWLKQLFAETEGKSGKGILPMPSINTQDIHSLNQFIKAGSPIVFETKIFFSEAETIHLTKHNITMNELNKNIAIKSCVDSYKNNVPCFLIEFNKMNAYCMGEMMKFFMIAAITSAKLLDVNPFAQPEVEQTKKLLNNSFDDILIF